jgi:hypothetical protein
MNSKMMILAAGVMASAMSSASVWTFDWKKGDSGQGGNAGTIKSIKSTFDDVSDRFTYSFTIDKKSGNSSSKVDGFYLAMNDGPNPKGKPGELAILYFDARDTNNLKLTAYGYNGKTSGAHDSWKDGSTASGTQAPDKILSSITNTGWINNMSYKKNADGSVTASIDIKAAGINNRNPLYPSAGVSYEGIAYDNKVGIWFGAVDTSWTGYGTDGFLKSFDFGDVSYVDASNLNAVPEPLTLLGVAGLALASRLRKKS